MNFSAWSIKNPIPAVMLFVLLTLAGLTSFNAMKVQQFPDMELPFARNAEIDFLVALHAPQAATNEFVLVDEEAFEYVEHAATRHRIGVGRDDGGEMQGVISHTRHGLRAQVFQVGHQ